MKGTSPDRASRLAATIAKMGMRISSTHAEEGKSMTILYVGIDLAKSVFAVPAVDEHGKDPSASLFQAPGVCDP
jgi:hypothetical protein